MRWGVLFVCAAALLASAGDARADDAARKAFERGKELRDQGDCTRAIPEFEKSIASERSIGAFYNLGYCHEQLGRRQAAYDAYKQAQQLASKKKDDRLPEISGAIANLLETPHIRLALPQPIPDGLQIRVDDELVPSATYQAETVIFTKPARMHSVVVTAPGYEERRETVETKQIKPIEMQRPSDKPASQVVMAPGKVESKLTVQHWVGIGLAGAGLVVGAIALGFVIDYLPKRADLNDRIQRNPCHDDKANQLKCDASKTAEERQLASELTNENNDLENNIRIRGYTLGAIAGGLIVAGVVTFLLSPNTTIQAPSKTTGALSNLRNVHVLPQVGTREQGLSIVGTF